MAKIYVNGEWVDLSTSVDETRLLPAVTSENTIIIGTSENKWGTTTKQGFLSDIDNRVSALESALGTVESSLDKIITGAAHSAITNKGGTGSAGTQNLVAAINSIPVGGGPGLETPDVYLKVEKLFTMTPAGKKGVYLKMTQTKKKKIELKRVNMNLPADLVQKVVEYGESKGLNTTSAYIVLLNQALDQRPRRLLHRSCVPKKACVIDT